MSNSTKAAMLWKCVANEKKNWDDIVTSLNMIGTDAFHVVFRTWTKRIKVDVEVEVVAMDPIMLNFMCDCKNMKKDTKVLL